MISNPSFAFTPLTEPTANVTPTPPPAPFNARIAYLMGQCCSLTYAQYAAGLNWTPDFSGLVLNGYTITASHPHVLTVYEANEPGPTAGQVGDYTQMPAGFVVQLTLTPTNGQAQAMVVVALRGTRSWDEWFTDADGFPTPFAATGLPLSSGLGSVHAGFYGLYTVGIDGLVVSSPLDPQNRAGGSIADQIRQYVGPLGNSLPLYVTGHSLGGALAALCALDIATNFPSSFSQIFMYSLASPRVAAGLSSIPTLDNQEAFLSRYQFYVPNSYPIVNAADLIPILGPSSTRLGPLTLTYSHVTDPFQLAGAATATASVSGGSVTSVTVTNSTFGVDDWMPMVVFSGGGGSGAAATAAFSIFHDCLEVTVTSGGSGYTSAPSVQLVSSGSLAQNVVNFCVQTGDAGGNHACDATYVPYLQALAAGF